MKYLTRLLALILLFSHVVYAQMTPMVDGDCSEYSETNSNLIELSKDVNWYIYQGIDYVWFCFTFPKGGVGMIDLQIETDKTGGVINLHSSAQLGEWKLNGEGSMPKTQVSSKWWNNNGWVASFSKFNGVLEPNEYSKTHANFKRPKAIEMQLSKKRFGRRVWNIHKVSLYHITNEIFSFVDKPRVIKIN
jgi:hypothetical protein